MAVREVRSCDIDPKHDEAKQYVFGIGPEFFSADLCQADADKLQAALDPFAKVGTPIEAREALRVNGGGFSPSVVRAWANNNGHQLGDRGRIPADVVGAWRKATGN